MNTHKNARLSYARRVVLVRRSLVPQANQSQLALEFGVARQTVRKRIRRVGTEGDAGLHDRSSRPAQSPTFIERMGA